LWSPQCNDIIGDGKDIPPEKCTVPTGAVLKRGEGDPREMALNGRRSPGQKSIKIQQVSAVQAGRKVIPHQFKELEDTVSKKDV